MADERASITITVTDEASSKIKEISDAFEQMRQKMQQSTQATNENAKQLQESHEKHKQHIAGHITAYTTLGGVIRTTVTEGVRGMNAIGLAMGPVTKSLEAAATFGGSFARAVGVGNLAIGGFVALAGAAVAGTHLLARSFADASEKAENFRRISGIMDQGMVDRMTKARQLVGMSFEQAQQSMMQLNRAVRDLATRGAASELSNAARVLGGEWPQRINQIYSDIRAGKKTVDEGRESLLDFLGSIKDPEARRYAADMFHIDPIEIERRETIKRLGLSLIGQSKEVTEAQKKLADETIRTQVAYENLKTSIWNAIGPTSLGYLEAFEKGLTKIIDALAKGDFSKLNPFNPQNIDPNQAKPPGQGGSWIPEGSVMRNWTPFGLAPGSAAPARPQQSWGDWWRQRMGSAFGGGGGYDASTPLRFTGGGEMDVGGGKFIPDLGWIGQTHGGYSTNIEDRRGDGGQPVVVEQMKESQRETADHSRESVDHLRGIRDVMEWLKRQIESGGTTTGPAATADRGAMVDPRTGATFGGAAGTGGTGFGGALGGFAGGGGGRRTGAPWFGGAAGRGTGGVPSMGQGGPGSGQDFYNQALAQVRSSGLVGQVPPDGAQFGITTGSAEEWARFMTGVAKAESNFNPRSANTSDPGGSFGVLQYAHGQVPGGNAYDTNASIQAFIRDAQQAVGSGGIRSPASLLRRRFSTIGSHPERTIRNLLNYGGSGDGIGAGQGGPSTVISDRPGVTSGSVGHVAGTVQLGGQTFHWGSGGTGRGSIPFGTFPINPAWTGQGQLGDIGRRIGSIATIGGRGGEIADPNVGMRGGIQIHRGSTDDLNRLYSAGCFAVAPSDWPRFRAALMAEVSKHPEGLFLTVNRNGQAFIGPRGQAPQAVGQVGRVPSDAPRGGGVATRYRGLPIRSPEEQERDQERQQQFGGEFEPRDPSGQPLHRGVGGERVGASLRNIREAQRREREESRRAAREGAPLGGATPPGQTADRPSDRGVERLPRYPHKMTKDEVRAYRDFTKKRIYDAHTNKTDEDEQADLDRSLRRFRERKGIFDQPMVTLRGEEVPRQKEEDEDKDIQIDPRTGRRVGRAADDATVDPRTGKTAKRAGLDVNVSAPKGTKVKAERGDVFDDVKVKQHTQMTSPDEE